MLPVASVRHGQREASRQAPRLDQQKVGAAAADLARAAGELQRESEVLLDATDMEEHPDLRVAHALIVLVAQPAIAEAARLLERLGRDPSDTEPGRDKRSP